MSEKILSDKKCLLKKTQFGKLEFCKDELNLDRYSNYQIIKCLRKHNVKHCVNCKFYPKENSNEK